MSVGRMSFADYEKTAKAFCEEAVDGMHGLELKLVTKAGAVLLAQVEISVLRDIFDTFEAKMASDTAAHIRERIEKLQKEAGIEVGIGIVRPVR